MLGQDRVINLWLVRHGESVQNVRVGTSSSNAIQVGMPDYPDHAAPLTDEGMQQALRAGNFLAERLAGVPRGNILIYSSPYVRAHATADAIRHKLGMGTVRLDDMLVELDFGLFDSVPSREIPSRFPAEYAAYARSRRHKGKFFARRPCGESPLDCEIRQKFFKKELYDTIAFNMELDDVIIVGHGAQLNVLRKLLLNYTYQWYDEESNPGNASIRLLRMPTGAPIVDEGYVFGGPAEKHGPTASKG